MAKLVRNKIPELIEKSGKPAPYHILPDAEYRRQLFAKLVEEARELDKAQNLEEIADVHEVLLELKKVMNLTDSAISQKMKSKRESNGGFDQKICLDLNTPNKVLDNVLFLQKCIILNKDQKVLALKRSPQDKCRASCWDLPGGTYESGEEVIAAIKREVFEESSLEINSLQPVYVANGTNFSSEFMNGENVFAITYVCSDWSGEVQISAEHTEFKWVTPEQFLKLNFGDDEGFFVASMRSYISMIR